MAYLSSTAPAPLYSISLSTFHLRILDTTHGLSDKPFNGAFSSSESIEVNLYIFNYRWCLHWLGKYNKWSFKPLM